LTLPVRNQGRSFPIARKKTEILKTNESSDLPTLRRKALMYQNVIKIKKKIRVFV